MNELTLQELKNIEFELLNVFDVFCKENNIKYYLSNGTLLGAVKYKGFIPWDDDIDLLIPRQDYDRMITLFQDSNQYRLFSFEKDAKYRFPFAKLCDMTTRKVEDGHNNGVDLGVNLDLFPLDAWENDGIAAKKEMKRIRNNMMFLLLTKSKKVDAPGRVKWVIKKILQVFCRMAGGGYFIKKIIKMSRNAEEKGSRYLGCKVWCVYGEKEIVPSDVFSETVEVEFEGKIFPAPRGYDLYLKRLYGEYTLDPPKEKQKTHHSFKAYRV